MAAKGVPMTKTVRKPNPDLYDQQKRLFASHEQPFSVKEGQVLLNIEQFNLENKCPVFITVLGVIYFT